MTHIPAMLTGLARRFGRKTVVTQIKQLSEGLVLVDFAGADLVGRSSHPGGAVEVLVSAQELRHYTLLSFDAEAGACQMLMQLHSAGPGSAWVRGLEVGDEALLYGPGGRPWLKPGATQLMLGDATAVGLFRALIDALPAGTFITGAVQIPEPDADAVRAFLPELPVVESLREWTKGLTGAPDMCYLAGHAQSLNLIRQDLLAGNGSRPPLGRRQIMVQAYWATGKTGL